MAHGRRNDGDINGSIRECISGRFIKMTDRLKRMISCAVISADDLVICQMKKAITQIKCIKLFKSTTIM